MKAAIAAGKKAVTSRSKRSWSDGEGLRTAVDKNYERVSSRKMVPTRWKSEPFLREQGLFDDFVWMHYLTYRDITNEFLAGFKDTLEDSRIPPRCSFTLGGVPRSMTLTKWCDCFGFENRGFIDTKGVPIAEASGTWDLISVKDEHQFSGAKVASIQNSTIRYFMTFVANTIFGRQHVGGMSSYRTCVCYACSTSTPTAVPKPNLGALLIASLPEVG